MKQIFRRNGQYFGFVRNGRIFTADSSYIGWLDDDDRVWEVDGNFLGEIVDEEYILCCGNMAPPARSAARARPATPATPARPADRADRAMPAGWSDALNKYPDQ